MCIYLLRNLLDFRGQLFRYLRRADLLAMAVVLGIIVEILIFRNDFDYRKSLDLSPVQIGSAGISFITQCKYMHFQNKYQIGTRFS